MSEIMSMAALDYLRRGYHLLALTGKRPHPKYHEHWSWDESIHGMPENPDQMAVLSAVFDDPTVTGIAILIPKNVLVADIDTDAAAQVFSALVEGSPRGTVVARTTKGLHIWYLAPGADHTVWVGGHTLLLKGFGGYVAVWPSKHFAEDGTVDGGYLWVRGFETGIDWLPDRLAEAIKAANLPKLVNLLHDDDSSLYMHPEIRVPDGVWTGKLWPESNIEGLKNAIINAEDGNQNNMIAWAARTALEDGVPSEVLMRELMDAAKQGHHPESRARTTIMGVIKRHRV